VGTDFEGKLGDLICGWAFLEGDPADVVEFEQGQEGFQAGGALVVGTVVRVAGPVDTDSEGWDLWFPPFRKRCERMGHPRFVMGEISKDKSRSFASTPHGRRPVRGDPDSLKMTIRYLNWSFPNRIGEPEVGDLDGDGLQGGMEDCREAHERAVVGEARERVAMSNEFGGDAGGCVEAGDEGFEQAD